MVPFKQSEVPQNREEQIVAAWQSTFTCSSSDNGLACSGLKMSFSYSKFEMRFLRRHGGSSSNHRHRLYSSQEQMHTLGRKKGAKKNSAGCIQAF